MAVKDGREQYLVTCWWCDRSVPLMDAVNDLHVCEP